MRKLEFLTFDGWQTARVITSFQDTAIVYCRNPYGTHNFILCQEFYGDWQSIRHGNLATLDLASLYMPKKQIRKAFTFLAKKGIRFEVQGL